jgi:hypothetical protein
MKTGIVSVQGSDFRWAALRKQGWASDSGPYGHSVAVTKVASGNRELILEFDRDPRFHRGMAKHLRLRIPDRRLIECILKAIEAGWNPESRGKAFVFKAGPPSRH